MASRQPAAHLTLAALPETFLQRLIFYRKLYIHSFILDSRRFNGEKRRIPVWRERWRQARFFWSPSIGDELEAVGCRHVATFPRASLIDVLSGGLSGLITASDNDEVGNKEVMTLGITGGVMAEVMDTAAPLLIIYLIAGGLAEYV